MHLLCGLRGLPATPVVEVVILRFGLIAGVVIVLFDGRLASVGGLIGGARGVWRLLSWCINCLLYTSDAADEMD